MAITLRVFPRTVASIRTGIANAPINQFEFGVITSSYPGRAAACFPGFAGPGLVAGVTGAGNGPEPPGAFSRFCVVSIHEAANSCLAARDTRHDLSVDGEGRSRNAVADLVVGYLCIPAHRTGF